MQDFSIHFQHNGATHTLAPGGHYAAPKQQGFRDIATSELRAIVAEVEAGRPWTRSARTAQPRPQPSEEAWALDIGAGWGQTSRPLARTRPVVALEPVSERLAFIKASARQEGSENRLVYVEVDYLEVNFVTRFQVITAIGVLEWVGAFQDTVDPQERQRAFLRKVRAELAPGGCLVVGIENRLGLKYLMGCPDDHTGVPHISVLPAPRARARWKEHSQGDLTCFTYSQAELALMLAESGFDDIGFFAAFPDYKLPEKIVPLHDGGAGLNAWLAQEDPPADHNGHDGSARDPGLLRSLALRYRALGAAGAAHPFVPSFFVVAR